MRRPRKSAVTPTPNHTDSVRSKTERNAVTTLSVPPRGFTIPQAAAYSALSPWTIERLIRSGKLPAIKLSRHYVILRETLDEFLSAELSQVKSAQRTVAAGGAGKVAA